MMMRHMLLKSCIDRDCLATVIIKNCQDIRREKIGDYII